MIAEIDWHAQGLIPELLYFKNRNDFTGSVNNPGRREFRYRLSPAAEKPENGTEKLLIRAEVWFGPFCYEKSKMEASADFPMDESGRNAAVDWVAGEYAAMIPDAEA